MKVKFSYLIAARNVKLTKEMVSRKMIFDDSSDVSQSPNVNFDSCYNIMYTDWFFFLMLKGAITSIKNSEEFNIIIN